MSKERSSSLIFAIDDTSSMSDEIAQVKLRTIEIFNAVLESNSSLIGNFLLVTLNDPGVVLRTITTSEHEFRRALDAIVVDGGGDCPEMALSGIELGIDSSNPESFLYVFTDASALDYTKYDIVSKKALMKGIEVTFLLTGNCGCESCPDYRVYNRLAAATGGQVFHLDKSDVSEVLKYIIDSIKSKNCLIDHILPKADGRVIMHQNGFDDTSDGVLFIEFDLVL
ncbi:hemicentin-2-like [Zerene cesonia]|uniref:hemicentin-2-like n=1 Tax=Zerene cesonia TaxID=33412 RepID=UPI0018E4E8DA|nr:hemicentin-2-like [Zerene cesonia]